MDKFVIKLNRPRTFATDEAAALLQHGKKRPAPVQTANESTKRYKLEQIRQQHALVNSASRIGIHNSSRLRSLSSCYRIMQSSRSFQHTALLLRLFRRSVTLARNQIHRAPACDSGCIDLQADSLGSLVLASFTNGDVHVYDMDEFQFETTVRSHLCETEFLLCDRNHIAQWNHCDLVRQLLQWLGTATQTLVF